ncbi:MAG TPA: hypothetical protein VK484_06535 [Ferruginibacter sp.]|nr:hypothetical protein [Ferruginibacter sp.]
MKRISFFLLFILFSCHLIAQLKIDNATFIIQPGATVTVMGDVTSNIDIQGTGKLQLKGTANQNVNMNGFSIPNLEIDNTANATLTGNAKIAADLLFTNGKIQLGNFNLTIAAGAAGTITNADNARFVVTDGTGKLFKAGLGAAAFTYPVGNAATTYNPVSISNPPAGVADDIGVKALAQVYASGATGTAFTKEVVDASWEITEAVAGGSNLSITASWFATDELSGFNRNKAGLSYYIPTAGPTQGWDLLNSQTGIAAGTNPYSYTRTGISSLGIFAVGTRPVLTPLLVSPKVILQGPANTGTGIMLDGLRTIAVVSGGTTDATHGVIPITEPYTGSSGFTHSGSGGAETRDPGAFGIFNVTNNDAVVDWVFVSIHDGVTGAVVSTRAAFVQRDGDVVETDGVSPLNMAGNIPGNYFVSVRHRNHLGIRSAANMVLSKTTSTTYDFSSAQAQAYQNPAILTNTAMKDLGGGKFVMWGGNANSNNTVRANGGANAAINDYAFLINTTLGGNATIQINNVYSNADLNMNATVRANGGANPAINDYAFLINSVLNGSAALIISQHQ